MSNDFEQEEIINENEINSFEINDEQENEEVINENDTLIKKLKHSYKEDKPKFIAGLVLGIVPLIFLCFYLLSSDDEKKKAIQDFDIPVSESEVYNSKVDGIENTRRQNDIGELENSSITSEENQTVNDIDNQNMKVDNFDNNEPVRPIENNNLNNSSYQPYGDKSMYTTYNHSKPKKRTVKEDDNFFDDEDYRPKTNNEKNYNTSSSNVNNNNSNNSKWVVGKNSLTNSKYKTSSNTSNTGNYKNKNYITEKLYKANIYVSKPKYITQENNRVQIRVIEPFIVNGVNLKQGQILTAYAQFSNVLKMEIKSVLIDGNRIPVNISVLDSQGQEEIEVIGGTGAEIKDNVNDAVIEGTRTGNGIVDKAISIFKGKKKAKVLISNDYVFLRVNE